MGKLLSLILAPFVVLRLRILEASVPVKLFSARTAVKILFLFIHTCVCRYIFSFNVLVAIPSGLTFRKHCFLDTGMSVCWGCVTSLRV